MLSLLSMHCRTLNRRLESYGTHFQQLVEETRFDLARQYLADTAMTVTQVAAALAYAQPSAFTRAFRRWSGTTPARWRETRRQADREPRGSVAPVAA